MIFFRAIDVRWLLLAVVLAGLVSITGCASSGNEAENMSERPWNTPKGWENGLPGGMMQGH